MYKCLQCNNYVIEDASTGEYVCPKCGYVAAEFIPSFAPDYISKELEDKFRNTRYGAPLTFSRHDNGLSTDIANTNKDFSGNKLNIRMSGQMNNIKKWHNITKISSSKDKRLSNVLSKINWFCETLSLPKVVNETAALLYRNYENKNDAKNKIVISIALAFVCLACKKSGILKSVYEIADACSIDDKKQVSRAARYYRELLMHNNIDEDNTTINKYISKTVNLLRLDLRVAKLAIEFAENTNAPSLTNGKNPNGFAAAYIYMAAVLLGINIQESEITSAANITETTLRKRFNEIVSNHKIKLVLKAK
ncbi:MAG: TFIIB-type zinc ribbon-containing protein [Candidatus Nitrosocaldaceae archaeon]